MGAPAQPPARRPAARPRRAGAGPRGTVAGVRALWRDRCPLGRPVRPLPGAPQRGGRTAARVTSVGWRSARATTRPVHDDRRQHDPVAPRPLQRPGGPPEPGRGDDRGRRGHGAPPPPGRARRSTTWWRAPARWRSTASVRRSAAGDAILIPPGAWHRIRRPPRRAGAPALRVRAPLDRRRHLLRCAPPPEGTHVSRPPDPPGAQPGPRRRLHVLRAGRGPDPDRRLPLRARAARHRDAQRLGPRGAARGDRAVGARLRVPLRPLPAAARTAPRWASGTARWWSRARRIDPAELPEPAGGDPGRADERLPRAPARGRAHRRAGHRARSTGSSTWSRPARWTPAW